MKCETINYMRMFGMLLHYRRDQCSSGTTVGNDFKCRFPDALSLIKNKCGWDVICKGVIYKIDIIFNTSLLEKPSKRTVKIIVHIPQSRIAKRQNSHEPNLPSFPKLYLRIMYLVIRMIVILSLLINAYIINTA